MPGEDFDLIEAGNDRRTLAITAEWDREAAAKHPHRQREEPRPVRITKIAKLNTIAIRDDKESTGTLFIDNFCISRLQ